MNAGKGTENQRYEVYVHLRVIGRIEGRMLSNIPRLIDVVLDTTPCVVYDVPGIVHYTVSYSHQEDEKW